MDKDIENTENKKENNVDKNNIEESNKSSNDKKREVVMRYRKPSFFSALLLFLLGVIVTTIVFVSCFYLKILPDICTDTDSNSVEQEESIPEVDLDINGEFIQELYKKIPSTDKIPYNIVYANEKITQGKITDYNKMLYILILMRENSEYETIENSGLEGKLTLASDIENVDVYDAQNVLKKYREYFGCDTDILRESITDVGYMYDYDAQNDRFLGHFYEGGGNEPYAYITKIDSAKKSEDGKEIYIYDYFLSVETYGSYRVFGYAGDNNISIGQEDAIYEEGTSNINTEIIDKYIPTLTKFKSTFKIDKLQNYYWVSTEPVTDEIE